MIFVKPISFKRHRFPADVIRHAVWLYVRFSLSLREVEELMAERGIDVTYETIRCWTIKFGPLIARSLRRHRPAADPAFDVSAPKLRLCGQSRQLASQQGRAAFDLAGST